MPTIRQIEANRQNAQRSTGPRTETGKAISSLNNLKHGLRAATVVLPMENAEDFDREYQDLLNHCMPEGPIEHHLVEQMVECRWKSIRSNVFIHRQADAARDDAKTFYTKPRGTDPTPDQVMLRLTGGCFGGALDKIESMQQRYDRAYLRAERRLAQIQKERRQREQLEPGQPQSAVPVPEPEPGQVGQALPPANPPAAEPNRKSPALAAEPEFAKLPEPLPLPTQRKES